MAKTRLYMQYVLEQNQSWLENSLRSVIAIFHDSRLPFTYCTDQGILQASKVTQLQRKSLPSIRVECATMPCLLVPRPFVGPVDDFQELPFVWPWQDAPLGRSRNEDATWVLNTFLVLGILLLLSVLHTILLSYLEASWLAQVRAVSPLSPVVTIFLFPI